MTEYDATDLGYTIEAGTVTEPIYTIEVPTVTEVPDTSLYAASTSVGGGDPMGSVAVPDGAYATQAVITHWEPDGAVALGLELTDAVGRAYLGPPDYDNDQVPDDQDRFDADPNWY